MWRRDGQFKPTIPIRRSRVLVVVCATVLLGACSSHPTRRAPITEFDGPPARSIQAATISDAIPRHEPYSKYGNPRSYKVMGRRYYTLTTHEGYVQQGVASWYGRKFHGRNTASGERYNMYAMTAAHKTLPLPTYARVTNLSNGRSVVVKINDRGPFHDNRLIDLSYVAADKLGIVKDGTAMVEVKAITTQKSPKQAKPPPPNAGLYIQVGAFSNRLSAEQLQSRLKNIPTYVHVSESSHEDHTVYRVRAGPFANEQQAYELVATIAALGLTPYVVVE